MRRKPVPQAVISGNVGEGGLDDFHLVAAGQQILAAHLCFSTKKHKIVDFPLPLYLKTQLTCAEEIHISQQQSSSSQGSSDT